MNHASIILLLLDLGADPRKPTKIHKYQRRDREVTSDRGSFAHTFLATCGDSNPNRRHEIMSHTDRLNILKKLKELGIHIHGAKFSEALAHEDFHPGSGSEKLLEFYLEEGANPDTQYAAVLAETNTGKRFPVLQKYLNHPSILKLLRSYAADVGNLFYGDSVSEYVHGLGYTIKDFRVHDPEAAIKALTDPVELKYPRSSGSSDDPRVPSLKAKIERLESQLLACGQSLETCESEKASMRSQLYDLQIEIDAISERLTRARGESRDKDRTIDGLNRVIADLERTIRLLRAAVDDGLLTTNRLNAEIERLKEEIRILRDADPSAGERERESPQQEEQEESVPDPEPSSGFECKTPYNRSTATARQRIASCAPAEGGVFDKIRTATGGRYTHKQKCIEECYIP